MTLEIDFETRSDIDLLKAGVYKYFDSKHADVLLASYRLDGGPWRRWRRGQPCPPEIIQHVFGGIITAHNAAFERLAWQKVLTPKHGWPKVDTGQFRCTATTAAALSLPRSLYSLGKALKLDVQKSSRGKQLIDLLSIPQGWIAGQPIWNDDPALTDEFASYCETDVQSEAEADTRLVPLSDAEQAVYVMNERINDRGLRLDLRSAKAAVRLAKEAKSVLDAEMAEVTGGAVRACTEVGKLTAWIRNQGVQIDTAGKEDVEELLEDDTLPDRVRRALELRQEAAKSSVSKIQTMLDRCSEDGRIRGVYLHHGAGQTGRFSARGAQLHNMPRYRKVFETAIETGELKSDDLFRLIRTGSPQALRERYGPELGRPLHLLSDALRGFLWAAPGHEYIAADYTSIEGVLAAAITGEKWKFDAYAALAHGEGHGIYELAAAGIYGVPVGQIGKDKRMVGKVAELALGYNGGVGALSRMARANRLKLASVFGPVWESAYPAIQDRAEERFEEVMAKSDETALRLGRQGWLAAELIKIGWRAQHPAIVAAWRQLDEAATEAIQNPGHAFEAVTAAFVVRHGFLWMRLPSGRCLAYGMPRIDDVEAPWADKTVEPSKREKKRSITALGVVKQGDKEIWMRWAPYGGAFFNHLIQGTARDILVHGMQKAEVAGYPIVLHTHDEMAAELPRDQGDLAKFCKLICEMPDFAKGLQGILTASGWRGKRYRK